MKYEMHALLQDGVWKIWHLQMAYDFVPGLPAEMVAEAYKQLGDLAWKGLAGGTAVESGERMNGALPPGFTERATIGAQVARRREDAVRVVRVETEKAS